MNNILMSLFESFNFTARDFWLTLRRESTTNWLKSMATEEIKEIELRILYLHTTVFVCFLNFF